jgi:hypothetical protein
MVSAIRIPPEPGPEHPSLPAFCRTTPPMSLSPGRMLTLLEQGVQSDDANPMIDALYDAYLAQRSMRHAFACLRGDDTESVG